MTKIANSARALIAGTALLLPGMNAAQPATEAVLTGEMDEVPFDAEPLAPVWAADTINTFGVRVLAQNLAHEETAGQLVSPLSLAAVLLMVTEGAWGETEESLAQAFGFSLQSQSCDVCKVAELLGELGGDPGNDNHVLRLANALWAEPDLHLKPEFAEGLESRFQATVGTMDFTEAEALDTVNAWIADRTGGMIDPMLDELDPDTRLLLANALYFKADWQVKFDPEKNVDKVFHALDGEPVTTAFMRRDGTMPYREKDGAQAVSLAFDAGEKGPAYDMTLVLPPTDMDGRIWGAALSLADWGTLLKPEGFENRKGHLELPKVSLRTGGDIGDQLKPLGFDIAYDRLRADFSAMSEEPLVLDKVVHRVALDWDETGAEAAAATTGTMVTKSMPRQDEAFHLVLDRPFFVVLRERNSGAILLFGLVTNPETAKM